MLCCKKGNYSPKKKNSNNNQKVTLNSITNKYKTSNNTLKSFRKKNPKKDSLTIQFKSNLI